MCICDLDGDRAAVLCMLIEDSRNIYLRLLCLDERSHDAELHLKQYLNYSLFSDLCMLVKIHLTLHALLLVNS